MDGLSWLRSVEEDVRVSFGSKCRVLSFDAFISTLSEDPRTHSRSAAQYVRDCFDHFGHTAIDRPQGTITRFNLFDCPWDHGRERLVGHEDAQGAVYKILANFAREGCINRLILLHGPNGSAKTSFVQCIARALEHYSTLDCGTVYRFNWVFPSAHIAKKRLGFASDGSARRQGLESFAHLEDEDVDTTIPGDLNDHPLLLLPARHRKELFESLTQEGEEGVSDRPANYLVNGDLSPRSRRIADTLLRAYGGDLQRVLQHVQVERFFFSRRYRMGCVTIEPQMHVDASTRQVTADQSLQSLPASLRNLNLFEPQGDLVDANRGMVEFNDLLKKPIESYKYLLATCEKGTVALANAILHLDSIFVATSNDLHLNAFKGYQDFPSFKGRMELVRMPYLRNYKLEESIYALQLEEGEFAQRAAPHCAFTLALWSVLTRLRKAQPGHHPTELRDTLANLTPLQKAELYAGEREPPDLTQEVSRALWANVPALLAEDQGSDDYEGGHGASPREMKQVLLNALQNPNYRGLSPMAIFDELEALVESKSIFEFLQRDSVDGYCDHKQFISQTRERYFDRIDNEVRSAMGLVSEEQYSDLFERYILHVSYLNKKEKLYNESTGQREDPDTGLMDQLEAIWKVAGKRETFRQDLVARVGAWHIDFPGDDIDYRRLFPKLFEALEADFYRQQKSTIRKLGENVLDVLALEDGDSPASTVVVSDEESVRAESIITQMVTQFHHPRFTLRDSLAALMKHRYR